MSGEPGLVGLLYRADWTRLALSAEVSDGSAVLVAPGKRYRYQTAGRLTGCDGRRAWELPGDDEGSEGRVHWIGRPEPPLAWLLCPAWLLVGSRLQVRGHVQACGRAAIDVVMTRRPSIQHRDIWPGLLPAGAEVLVDAELGILLRVAEPGRGGRPEVTELASADFAPVVDPALFSPPPGSRIAESFAEASSGGGPAWWAAKTAAGLAAGGLGAWIRYSPFGHAPSSPSAAADAEASISADPAPERSPEGVPSGPPVGDDLLDLLHAGGCAEFTATLHQWVDIAAMASQVPPAARAAGFGGLGLLMDAVSQRPATAHHTCTVRIAGPGRYQINHDGPRRRGPKTVACDGERCFQIYDDKVTAGPTEPPSSDIASLASLADPSWLLRCALAGGTAVTVNGRPAYRIDVTRGHARWSSMIFPAAVAVIDAGLGIILQLTYYIGSAPVQRYELRDPIATAGDGFRVDIPPGLPVVAETRPRPGARPLHPAHIASGIASAAARQAASETAKTARHLWQRLDPRQPRDQD